MRSFRILVGLGMVGVITLFAVQFHSMNQLRAVVEDLQAQRDASSEQVTQRVIPPVPATRSASERVVVQPVFAGDLEERLALVEQAVNKLADASDYLMERGNLPLDARKLAEITARMMDPSLPDNERLGALRLLRRNGPLSDEALQGALTWLKTGTDEGTRRSVLARLDGVTNSLFKAPLMELALAEPNSQVREEAVQNLRHFAQDPQVEQRLWDVLRKDSDSEVREEASQALRRSAVTEERLVSLRNRIFDANSSLEERITALYAIRRADNPPSDVLLAMAEFAQHIEDPRARAQVFSAFDGANDPAVKVPLVYGLQDPNPRVREEAADSLSGFRDDPQVMEWLRYVAENDENSRVRREAQQALGNNR